MTDLPDTVLFLWWAMLAVAVFLVLPLTIRLLHRAWDAVRAVRRHAADTRGAAEAIARNVARIGALDEAVAATQSTLQHAASLRAELQH